MFDGDWLGENYDSRLGWRWGALAGTITFLVWLLYSQHHAYEREQAAKQDRRIAIEACAELPATSLAKACVTSKKQAVYDQTKASYDLKAQQDMAEWSLVVLILTGIGVVLLYRTLRATDDTLGQAKRQSDLLLKQQKIDNPPRLLVKQVIAEIVAGQPLQVFALVVNAGNSVAYFDPTPDKPSRRADVRLVLTNGHLPNKPFDERAPEQRHEVPGARYLSGGEVRPWEFMLDEPVLTAQDLENLDASAAALFVQGFIRYGNELGSDHRVWFCREYNPQTKAFEPVDNPEYEWST